MTKVKYLTIGGYSLLNVRLWCYSVAFIHLLVTAITTLSIDVTKDEDPMVRAYDHIRWKLLTCVFNIISLVYLLLCWYCDWQEKQNNESSFVGKLRIMLDVTMTSILMPVTAFCCLFFWTLFTTYPTIIAPPRVFEYVPNWAQHSLHTIPMLTVVMDLVLTPRQRPGSMKPRLAVMAGFATVYCLIVYIYLQMGEPVYLFLSRTGTALHLTVYFSFLAILTFFFYAQWRFIDYVWDQNRIKTNKEKNKIK